MRCSVPPVRRACSMQRDAASRSWRTSPSATASSMTTTPCGTTRPLPMLMWPTSLLPITPVGSPTCSPLRLERRPRIALEERAASSAVSAAAIALPCVASRHPQPSRIARTSGRYRGVPLSAGILRRLAMSAANVARIEAGAADEPAVDVRLRDERADVVGVSRCRRRESRVRASPGSAARIVPHHAARLRGIARAAGADRPDRFVRDDAAREFFGGDSVEGRADLRDHALVGDAGVAFQRRLADGDDRRQALQPARSSLSD